MRLLCFQARRFAWRPFEHTVAPAAASDRGGELSRESDPANTGGFVADAVVAFVHVEASDLSSDRAASVFRQALKHLKWLANKRELRAIVLHSFAHLGGDTAAPDAAHALLEQLAERLRSNGYTIAVTPFGYSNEWELDVFGAGSAKVWKQI